MPATVRVKGLIRGGHFEDGEDPYAGLEDEVIVPAESSTHVELTRFHEQKRKGMALRLKSPEAGS